ncbi:hypothetical protein CLU79DRAFT_362573 [Phycomyces nitens]|nr:hypothetical protein CLU79DRAFT_362573 [Phycomyces nitens]
MLRYTWTFSNTDSHLGYALGYYFLEKRNQSSNKHNIRLLCHKKDGLEELERMGGEVIEVDYTNEMELRLAMIGTRYLMLNPEFSDNRLVGSTALLNVAKDEGVEYVTMSSFIGVDKLAWENDQEEFGNMLEYQKLEAMVKQMFGDENHCVVRLPFFSQSLYYFSPMIEKESMIKLAVDAKNKLAVVSLVDIVRGMHCLWTEDQNRRFNQRGNRTLFEFTSAYNQDGEDVSIIFSEALGRTIDYTQISVNEMGAYLREIRRNENFQERPFEKKSEAGFVFPIAGYLVDDYIRCLGEQLGLAGRGFGDILTDDLSNALQRKPQELDEFVQNNCDQFRRLR